MDRGAWQATVHGVAKSQTRLSDFTFTFHCLVYYRGIKNHDYEDKGEQKPYEIIVMKNIKYTIVTKEATGL